MIKIFLALSLCAALLLPLFGGLAFAEESAPYAAFQESIDMAFALRVATELSENAALYSSPLGSRNAGSDAEHAAAETIAGVMREIGLSDVEKVPITADKWSNNGSSLTLADGTAFKVQSYASGATPKDGITAEIVFAGEGTRYDFDAVGGVEGKIVLVDINQRENWWITYPTLEAELLGAAAIMLANTGGFSEVSADALNMNDFCGPVSIPSVSISQNSANEIKALLEKGTVTATLVVDNVVEEDNATTYNVVGRIAGKSSDHQIVIGSHYDTHYKGFQDNSCAVAFDLAIAKAMIDSGYAPENDIVFVAHGAEEWGAIGTVFDWSTGAYGMVTQARPEWVGKTLAFINSELPAFAFGDTTRSDTAPELYTFIRNYLESGLAPSANHVFPGGVVSEGYQTYTYSDDFSYYSAGIPSVINGFLLTDDREGVWDFYYQYYHSDFDTKDTYNEDVLRFNIAYYGVMAMYIDALPAIDLDYRVQHARIAASVDETAAREAGADVDAFLTALAGYEKAAGAAYETVTAINAAYAAAVDPAEKARLWTLGKEVTNLSLALFRDTQEAFLGLMYERPVVRHEAQQENIALMQEAIALLNAGDVVGAVDGPVWQINNINEWYALSFSPGVTAILNDMMFGERAAGNLFWGTNRQVPYANVEEATRSLYAKYDAVDPSFEAEIAIYTREIAAARAQYAIDMANETAALAAQTAKLLEIAAVRP